MRSTLHSCTFLLALVQCLIGCSSPEKAPEVAPAAATPTGTDPVPSNSAEEWNVREAVFRHQFRNNASGAQQNVGVYFLDVEGKELSRAFLDRFADHSPEVEPFSAARTPKGERIEDEATGAAGLLFRQDEIRWISSDKAEVDGGYWEGPLSSSGNTYTVERQGSEWVVTSDVMHWIS